MNDAEVSYVPTTYAAIAGWVEDDHASAFAAFLISALRVLDREASASTLTVARPQSSPELVEVCRRALELGQHAVSNKQLAREFFERHFTPHRVSYTTGSRPAGLLTGYYEPQLTGSRTQSAEFSVPIYGRPHDLVNLIDESERGARAGQRTHARQTADGLTPYFTRAQIDEGALAGRNLELGYVADPVDLFFMQVQGSGLVDFGSGDVVRLTYAGKNGYDYTSVGRYLIDTGEIASEDMTLQALIDWLKADPVRARDVMWQNESYVFFEELGKASETTARGIDAIALSAGRSLAVDTAFHEIGTPVFVVSESLTHAAGIGDSSITGFHRLMIAQDVGSAIRGPERGDLYFGSGSEAGRLAGQTKHEGQFIVLRPDRLGDTPELTETKRPAS